MKQLSKIVLIYNLKKFTKKTQIPIVYQKEKSNNYTTYYD